jgi:hypothetical protein
VRVVEDAAPSFGIEPIATMARDDGELGRTVGEFAAKPAGGLIILPDSFTTGHRDLIIALAARYRLPAVYPMRVFAASGVSRQGRTGWANVRYRPRHEHSRFRYGLAYLETAERRWR